MSAEEAEAFMKTSPWPQDIPSAEILAALFSPEEFVGLKATNQSRASRCRVANLPAFFSAASEPIQFVASSPISGSLGRTQDGGLSYVAKECVPVQRFVVVEFDDVPIAAQFGRVLFLKRIAAQHAPLAMVLMSGGKSVHSWFMPLSAEATDALKTAAVKLGADPAAFRSNQLVRCPNQLRDNGHMQSLLWLSPVAPFQ
ncbi:hypothetical protein [Luteolibacter sp. Populi]|uniref:hypothetical protein n=1 Tax=Luteolibacter sp. Populi TaxID=3230487 RepID=UPI0034674B2B